MYNTWIMIFIVSSVGVFVLLARHWKRASFLVREDRKRIDRIEVAFLTKLKTAWQFWWKRVLRFALSAKGLHPHALVGSRVREFRKRNPEVVKTEIDPLIQPLSEDMPDIGQLRESELLPAAESGERLALRALGKLYLSQHRLVDAVRFLEMLRHKEAGDADVYALLGLGYFRLQNFDLAAENFKKSVALDSTISGRFYNLGLAYAAIGDKAKAVEAVQHALQLAPENQKYQATLEKLNRATESKA